LVLVRKLILILLSLSMALGVIAYFFLRQSPNAPAAWQYNIGWLFFILTTALNITLIAVNRRGITDCLSRIRKQLQQFEQTNQIGLIMVNTRDDLAGLVKAINHYLTSIKFYFDQNRINHKELQIQLGVSETERRQTEAIIHSISDGVLVTDKYDELVLANHTAQELFDFYLKTCYRQPIDEIIDEEKLLELIHQARRQKSRILSCMLEKNHPQTGRLLDLKISVGAVLDEDRQVIGVVTVIQDMTAEKELARMKDDFVNGVSHELKTPLASIRAYAEMLADHEAENQKHHDEFCAVIQEQADRLNRLIDNILNISLIEAGVLFASPQKLDMNDITADVIQAMRPQAAEKNIILESSFSRDSLWITADRDMIHQAVMNLISNALKYSLPGQTVSIRTHTNKLSEAALHIQDRGIGIPRECQEHIFEKFYRVPDHNNLTAGTGLGLSLVQKIVRDLHHGRITFDSAPGQGSTFTIYLPLCHSPQPVSTQLCDERKRPERLFCKEEIQNEQSQKGTGSRR